MASSLCDYILIAGKKNILHTRFTALYKAKKEAEEKAMENYKQTLSKIAKKYPVLHAMSYNLGKDNSSVITDYIEMVG